MTDGEIERLKNEVSVGHVVIQLLDGSVWGWGTNASGELGDGTSGNSRELPVQAIGINLN